MTRYKTRNYVAVDETDARRLAKVDGTPWDKVKITEGVEPIHRTDSWTLWSDMKFTTSIGLPKDLKVKSLTPDAEDLIETVYGADGGMANVPGDLLGLAEVDTIIQERPVESGEPRGVYVRPTIKALWVRLRDGSEHTWYSYSEGYQEGYVFNIYDNLDDLYAELRKIYQA